MTDHSSGENGKEDIIIETETSGEDNAPRGGHIHILGMSLYLIALIAYISISIFFPAMWGKLCIVFLAVPVIDSIPQAIMRRSLKVFNFPVLVVCTYLAIGLFAGLWHPTWIMFLAIPVWSWLVRGAKFFEIR